MCTCIVKNSWEENFGGDISLRNSWDLPGTGQILKGDEEQEGGKMGNWLMGERRFIRKGPGGAVKMSRCEAEKRWADSVKRGMVK